MKKQIFGTMLAFCMLAAFVPCAASAATAASGDCGANGDNVTWTLDDTGTLTISGAGDMKNYSYNRAPWYGDRSNIAKVIIEDGVTSIGDYAFQGCSELTNIDIPDSVTKYGTYIFQRCASLPEIIIPKDTTFIQMTEYSGCKSAKRIIFNDKVEHISASAFAGCVGLTELILPDSVKAITEFAFRDCTGLEYVQTSKGQTSVYLPAFKDCSNIKTMVISPTIETVTSTGFSGCNRINFVVDEANEFLSAVDGVLFSKDGTKLVSYAKSMLEPSYTVPNGVREISYDAFGDCTTDITIPKSVTKIPGLNDNIKDVYYMGTADDWDKIFTGRNLNATVHYNAVGSASPKIDGTLAVSGSQITIPLADVEYDSDLFAVFGGENGMVSFERIGISAGDTEKTASIPEGAKSVKVFVWDSLSGMKPLCEAAEAQIR